MNAIKKHQQRGITLLEILLVLAIGASFIMLSIRQYQALNLDKNIRALRANVDTVFSGLSNYYYVNCYGTFNPATRTLTYGKLNPDANPLPNYSININTDLVLTGFLATTNPTILPFNPLVNQSGPVPKGYIAQFNRQNQWRWICVSGSGAINGPSDPACTNTAVVGVATLWTEQVAVQLNSNIPPAQYDTYKNLAEADCLSAQGGSSLVQPCAAGVTGNYLVWERLPSMATTQNQTTASMWQNNLNLQQFNQLFNTYPTILTANPPQGNIPVNGKLNYYYCGG